MEARKEYEVLLRGGDLLEMFPKLSGQWERDKKIFTKIYEENKIQVAFTKSRKNKL